MEFFPLALDCKFAGSVWAVMQDGDPVGPSVGCEDRLTVEKGGEVALPRERVED